MVGEEVVKRSNDIKVLPEGAGENGSLKPNGNFDASPHLRRQLLTLAKVHAQSSDYYRAALMPVIRAAMAKPEART